MSKNLLQPSVDQFKAFRDRQNDEPIQMLNLLKFREKAAYEDGRETKLSGVEAYKLYTAEFRRLMEPQGVTVLYSGTVRGVVIGEGDLEGAWDAMLLIQYPTTQMMLDMFRDEGYQRAQHHRTAGLVGQLLLECAPGFTF